MPVRTATLDGHALASAGSRKRRSAMTGCFGEVPGRSEMPITKRRLLPVALLVLAAAAGPDRAAQAQAKDLTMGNVNPPKHGTSQAAQQFIDKLAETSGGKIKVVHHHSGALGGEREVVQQIQLGAID